MQGNSVKRMSKYCPMDLFSGFVRLTFFNAIQHKHCFFIWFFLHLSLTRSLHHHRRLQKFEPYTRCITQFDWVTAKQLSCICQRKPHLLRQWSGWRPSNDASIILRKGCIVGWKMKLHSFRCVNRFYLIFFLSHSILCRSIEVQRMHSFHYYQEYYIMTFQMAANWKVYKRSQNNCKRTQTFAYKEKLASIPSDPFWNRYEIFNS